MYLNLNLSSSDLYQKIGQLIYNLPCSSVKLKFKIRYVKVYFSKSEIFYMVIFFIQKKKKSEKRPQATQMVDNQLPFPKFQWLINIYYDAHF